MPKSYTEKERNAIIDTLRGSVMELLLQKGVKGTTVDELAARARIPKGTFYLFYESKDMLIYDALMHVEEETHLLLSQRLSEIAGDFTPDSLTTLLFDFYQLGFKLGISQLMVSGELDVLMRRLPDEIVAEHISKDDEFLTAFSVLFPSMDETALKKYSAAYRAVFFTAIYRREIGEYFDDALKMLIKGLVLQMWEETK